MAPEPPNQLPKDLPRIIGGYRVLRELGRGRLGPLLLARRLTSGRVRALRVVRGEWSCLPVYVSRLIRDAHAAAQVVHPNLVPIADLGEAQSRVYIDTDFVYGDTLAKKVESEGAFTPRDAVATLLQAARALRAAHAHGLSHGEVSPTTIFIDDDGRTRLAELGLTKTPSIVTTQEAREKTGPIELAAANPGALNLEGVRADLKGLGKTLAFLLTGKTGNVDPTSLISQGVPANFVELVRSLVDSKTGSGYQDMGQVVAAFEKIANARSVGGTTPREEDGQILRESLVSFRGFPTAKLRFQIVAACSAGCALLVLLGILAKMPLFAGSFLGLGLMTALAYFIVKGVTGRDSLFPDVRRLVLESRGADIAIVASVIVLLFVALYALNLQWAWLCFGILAVVLAVAFHHFGDLPVEAERMAGVEEARTLVKEMRKRGVAEDTIQSFVKSTAGEDWGAFFQEIFGEDARFALIDVDDLHMFKLWKQPAFAFRTLAASWVRARLDARKRERDTLFFQAIEERGLVAEGVNLLTARRKAKRIGEAMVAVTAEHRDLLHAASRGDQSTIADRPSVAFAVKQAVEAPEEVLVERERGLIGPDRSMILNLLTGPRTRFLLGAAILGGFLLWVHQNEIVSSEQIKDVAVKTMESNDPLKAMKNAQIDVKVPVKTKPLELGFLPRFISESFNGFHAGIAGLILVVSAFVWGSRVGFFAIPGALVTLFLSSTFGLIVGASVASLGLFFGTTDEDH